MHVELQHYKMADSQIVYYPANTAWIQTQLISRAILLTLLFILHL